MSLPSHRPPIDSPQGVHRIKLSPHRTTEPLTAVEDLFVLCHLGIPRVDPARWSLLVDGLVGRIRTFRLDELMARPKRVVEAIHQCCGNPLQPTLPTRRITHVRWGGLDLAALLDELGVDPAARFLWSSGLDGGTFAGESIDFFTKDLPLERLRAGEVLLAYELNGAPLPAEHGAPVRLVVPGYYGTNSVKWLWRLRLAEDRHRGLFTTRLYDDAADPALPAGSPERRPVWAIAPESIIVAPAPQAVVRSGEPVEVWGWAWSSAGVSAVEVSVDGGARYHPASLEARRGWSWQRFSFPWRPTEPGKAVLAARALEASGAGQPGDRARNAIHRVEVTID